jgi:high-affinity nickel permease
MFGLDSWVAGFSDGTTLVVVCVVAVVLGLRHATDPDHLAAVTTLVASGRGRGAARIGAVWGAGHATSLVAFGAPIVLARRYLPEGVQRDVETAVGAMIVVLAVSLIVRARQGRFHVHVHEHGDHVHAHGARTPWQAYAIGLVHGIGGSAGVGVLLLASISSRAVALVALVLFAGCTALSMSLLSAGVGATFSRPRLRASFARVAPAFGASSLAFGMWYALGAQGVVPYVF